ncbi:MAG: hypothetical protein Q8L48_01600 [Archangium sp.]|nr:hypothetical protein [Archangium sp.]
MSPASRSLSRCVVTLETSDSTAGELFGHRIDSAAERIEVLFDELEQGERRFVSPREAGFVQPRLAAHRQGDETCRVELLCTPPLTASELEDLTRRVAVLVSELPDITPRAVPAVDRLASDADTDPGEPPLVKPGDVPTKQHVPAKARREEAPTRPEGVMGVKRPVPHVDGADEVTDPQSKHELPTRPEGVISIRRRDDEA